ncbi:MAG: hypothetical protein Phog2KO_09420 [Phototrophicaceae bacterium]
MISLKLWHALSKPPRQHPLFQYVLADSKREKPGVTSGFVVWVLMLASFMFVWAVIFKPVMGIILALFVALNSIYATRWVLRISRIILEEKQSRRFDLLASLPIGLLGTSWALSTGAVHQRSSFRWLPYLILMVVIIAFIALCGLITVTFALLEQLSNNEAALMANLDFVRIGIQIIPFVILFYIDHIYSILTAIILGQIATIDIANIAEGQVRALLGFLAIQVMTYLIAFLISIVGLPYLFNLFGFTGVGHLVLSAVIGIAVFVSMREWTTYLLWSFLTHALEADVDEKNLVLKPFYEAEAILRESQRARLQHMDTA